ncbi:hypothetical protein MMC14_006232 [Varicellaria rhodocarpa]|nr:hypothetical protein [Varicellaria rhodocarpa]
MSDGFLGIGAESLPLERAGEDPSIFDVPDVFKSAIKAYSHSIDEEQLWLKHVSWNDMEDAVLALLLPALVNLETLDITLGHSRFYHYFGRMVKRAVRGEKPFDVRPPFISLNMFLHNGGPPIILFMGVEYFEYFLKLPSIRSISGCDIESVSPASSREVQGESSESIDPSSSSSVIVLKFDDCLFETTEIARILRIPRALIWFIFVLRERCGKASHRVSFLAIREALKAQEHCLISLMLDTSPFFREGLRRMRGHVIPITSLLSFQKLKVLVIHSVYVLGLRPNRSNTNSTDSMSCRRFASFFPKTLERLHFTYYLEHLPRLMSALKYLVLHRSERVPMLNMLYLEDVDGVDELSEEKFNIDARGENQKFLLVFRNTSEICEQSVEAMARMLGHGP